MNMRIFLLLFLSFSAHANQALFNAVEQDNEAEVRSLLTSGSSVDVNFSSVWGVTPLMISASHGNMSIAELLLNHGAKLNAVDGKSKNAVFNAADAGKIEMLKFLIQKGGEFESLRMAPTGGYYGWSWTTLNPIADQNDLETLEYLLSLGANPNFWQEYEGGPLEATPLMRAASRDHVEVAKRLIAAGADINLQTPNGGWCSWGTCSKNAPTAFEYAVANGSAGVARVLIDAGADQTAHGETSNYAFQLKDVVYKKHYELAKLFAEKKIGLGSDNGMWDLGYRGELEIIKALHFFDVPFGNALGGALLGKMINVVNYLVEQKDPGIRSSLAFVNQIDYGYEEFAEIMLSAGADANYLWNGIPVLYDAYINFKSDLAPLYIKHGANINYTLPNGNTLLIGMLSCAFPKDSLGENCLKNKPPYSDPSIYSGVFEVTNLLSLGANPSVKGAEGNSAIDLLNLLKNRKCGSSDECKNMKIELKKIFKVINT